MSEIKIRVGASLEANTTAVFEPIIKASARARDAIRKNLGDAVSGASKGGAGGGIKHNIDALDRELEGMADKLLRKEERSQRARTRAVESGTKERVRIERQAGKAIEEAEAQPARQRRGGLGSSGGAIGIGRRAGIRVSRGAAMAYGYGGAAASSFAHGIGINTDVASMVKTGVDNQDLAQKIVNSDPSQRGLSAASRQATSADLLGQAQQVSNATGTDTSDTLQGLEAFVAKTGDLDTARDTIQGLATLAKATGTNLGDMASAAAEVSNNLGDVPDKAKAVYDVMRAVAGAGQLGAVEIKDLASQMAKVATVAGRFEGDRGTNIAILTAMAQEAKLHGGAANASQATTAVSSFATQFDTKATAKHWREVGLNAFTDASHSQVRAPEELILEALKYASRGNTSGKNKGGRAAGLKRDPPRRKDERCVVHFSGLVRFEQAIDVDEHRPSLCREVLPCRGRGDHMAHGVADLRPALDAGASRVHRLLCRFGILLLAHHSGPALSSIH
jgi:hypothetical protein